MSIIITICNAGKGEHFCALFIEFKELMRGGGMAVMPAVAGERLMP